MVPSGKIRAPSRLSAASLTFIGPSAEAMEALGSKTAGRTFGSWSGRPDVPGTNDPIEKP